MITTRKSLIIYLPDLGSGGAERQHINLAPLFIEKGYDVTFLLHKIEGAFVHLVPAGVKLVSLECKRTLGALFPLIRFLRKNKPEFLISNMGHNNIVAIWAAKLGRVRTRIIASHHSALSAEVAVEQSWQYKILPVLCRLFLKYAQGIVAVSEGVADDLAVATKLSRERIHVIYNPVISAGFESRMMESINHPWVEKDAPPFLLAVGRLVLQKDFVTLIAAFAFIARTRNIRLMIIGEGHLRDELLKFAESLGLADRIIMPGFQANPLPFMRKASALVMSSRYEGFGNVLVEALACGTPVVSTDCPYGPAEVLGQGRYGKLVPVGNIQALVDAIIATIDNPPLKDMLQARGHEFTAERTASLYQQLFATL